MLLVGLDIGTTAIKAVAYGADGHSLALEREPFPCRRGEGGRAEADCEEVFEASCAALRRLSEGLGERRSEVAGLGLSAVMVGCALLDKRGAPTRRAILWNDGRAAGILEEWRRAGLTERCVELCGNTLTSGFPAPLLEWVRRHEPEVWKRSARYLLMKDWIRYRLIGGLGTCDTEGPRALGEIASRRISAKMLDHLGLSECAGMLPEVAGACEVAGELDKRASQLTGLPEGTPVAYGLGDVSANLVGLGSLEDGQASIILGTSCLSSVTTRRLVREPQGIGLNFLLPEGRYARSMPNQWGMSAVDWFRSGWTAGEPVSYPVAEERARAVPFGSGGALFHPYLSTAGIVAPVVDGEVRGAFTRLDSTMGWEHAMRAVFEGVALSIADNFGALPTHGSTVRLGGGGARSRFMAQLIADVCGFEVAVSAEAETGCLGAAICAGVAIGRWSSCREGAELWRRPERIHKPSGGETRERAGEMLARYRALRAAMASAAGDAGAMSRAAARKGRGDGSEGEFSPKEKAYGK